MLGERSGMSIRGVEIAIITYANDTIFSIRLSILTKIGRIHEYLWDNILKCKACRQKFI